MAGTVIAPCSSSADRVVAVAAGRVELRLPRRGGGGLEGVLRLGPGDVFGDMSLIGDGRWAGALGVSGDLVAAEDCALFSVPAAAALSIARAKYPAVWARLDWLRRRRLQDCAAEEKAEKEEALSWPGPRAVALWISMVRLAARRHQKALTKDATEVVAGAYPGVSRGIWADLSGGGSEEEDSEDSNVADTAAERGCLAKRAVGAGGDGRDDRQWPLRRRGPTGISPILSSV